MPSTKQQANLSGNTRDQAANLIWPGMPTVADGKVYVTIGEEAYYGTVTNAQSEYACINAYTGQLIWQLPMEALPPRESAIVAYGTLYIIPGSVTTAVDTTSGTEYTTDSQLWAIGPSTTLSPTPSTTPPPAAHINANPNLTTYADTRFNR